MFNYEKALKIVQEKILALNPTARFAKGNNCVIVRIGLATEYWIFNGDKIVDIQVD